MASLILRRTLQAVSLHSRTPCRCFAKNRYVSVVLLQDELDRAFTGEEILVKPGHARNYLIPTRRAVYATPENREKHIIERSAEERALMGEKRDFLLFKERAATKTVTLVRKVIADGETLEEPLGKKDVMKAIRKQLRRTVDESRVHLRDTDKEGRYTTTKQASFTMEVDLPQLLQTDEQRTTEVIEVQFHVTKGEVNKKIIPGFGEVTEDATGEQLKSAVSV